MASTIIGMSDDMDISSANGNFLDSDIDLDDTFNDAIDDVMAEEAEDPDAVMYEEENRHSEEDSDMVDDTENPDAQTPIDWRDEVIEDAPEHEDGKIQDAENALVDDELFDDEIDQNGDVPNDEHHEEQRISNSHTSDANQDPQQRIVSSDALQGDPTSLSQSSATPPKIVDNSNSGSTGHEGPRGTVTGTDAKLSEEISNETARTHGTHLHQEPDPVAGQLAAAIGEADAQNDDSLEQHQTSLSGLQNDEPTEADSKIDDGKQPILETSTVTGSTPDESLVITLEVNNENQVESPELQVAQQEPAPTLEDEATVEGETGHHEGTDGQDEPVHPITICYDNMELSLFCPRAGEEAASYLLEDDDLLYASCSEVFQACRTTLGIDREDCYLAFDIPDLCTTIYEKSPHASAQTLYNLLDLYVQLCTMDGHEHAEPFYVVLNVRQDIDARLQILHQALGQGQGLSQIRLTSPTLLEGSRVRNADDELPANDKRPEANDDFREPQQAFGNTLRTEEATPIPFFDLSNKGEGSDLPLNGQPAADDADLGRPGEEAEALAGEGVADEEEDAGSHEAQVVQAAHTNGSDEASTPATLDHEPALIKERVDETEGSGAADAESDFRDQASGDDTSQKQSQTGKQEPSAQLTEDHTLREHENEKEEEDLLFDDEIVDREPDSPDREVEQDNDETPVDESSSKENRVPKDAGPEDDILSLSSFAGDDDITAAETANEAVAAHTQSLPTSSFGRKRSWADSEHTNATTAEDDAKRVRSG